MSAPISPRHRPSADKIPDGMSLLYADLPDKPEPPPQRTRIELALAGMVAAAGAAAAGSGIAGDVVRRFVRPAPEAAAPGAPPSGTAPVTGIERSVGAPVVVPPELAPVPESEFAPPAAEESALAELEPEAAAPSLPPAAAPPRDATMGSSRPAPVLPEPDAPAPTTTTTTVAPTTTTTLPSTTTVPPSTTVVPAPTTTTEPPPTTTTTAPPQATEPPPAAHLLAAGAGYDVTPAAAATMAAAGFDGWLDGQLDPQSVPDPVVDDVLAGFSLLDTPPSELASSDLVFAALSEARWADFARAAFSERQVEAQLAALWRRWFALPADDVAAQLELDQLARTHALGRYADLVAAVAGSAGLRRAHGVDAVSVETLVDSSLVERVIVDWTYGPDAPIDDAAVSSLAEAIVAGPAATADLLARLMADPAAIEYIGRVIGELIGGPGSTAVAAAIEGFAREGRVDDAVRAALLDGGIAADRPATATAWLVRSLRRASATVTLGGAWDPADGGSVAGLLQLLGAQSAAGPRSDADERTPAAVAARWEAARTIAAGGSSISVDLAALVPAEPTSAGAMVSYVQAVVDLDLHDSEQQAILDYLGADSSTQVAVDEPTFIDLCALAMSFPSALGRTA